MKMWSAWLSMLSPRNRSSRRSSVCGLTRIPKASSVALREVSVWAAEQMEQTRAFEHVETDVRDRISLQLDGDAAMALDAGQVFDGDDAHDATPPGAKV